MREGANISILKTETTDDVIWGRVRRFVDEWSRETSVPCVDVIGRILEIRVEDTRDEAFDALLRRLDRFRDDEGVRYLDVRFTIYEPGDYLRADFVRILGAEVGADAILNVDEALAPAEPCQGCGWQDAFNRRQVGPFLIQEEVLAASPIADEAPPEGGWDLVNAPNGHLLISRRCLQLLEDVEARGFEVAEVRRHPGGSVSKRFFQLLADVVITEPCYEHTELAVGSVCAACGTYYGSPEAELHVAERRVGGRDLFAMHPSRGAMLYVGQRLYRALVDAGLNGLFPQDVAFVCRHVGAAHTP